jgi:large subunit ribosomal protein L4
MATVTVKKISGGDGGSVELPEDMFGIEPHGAVLHQVVTAQLAARRRGTHSTKTRAEVRGGGAKPWRQKGTGRARQGSIRAPHWRGGGVAHGPKPRDYSQRTPKKMVRLALRSALSDRAAEGNVVVIDSWDFTKPSTKDALAALDALGITGKPLVVLTADDRNAWLSFRNLGEVHLLETGQLNAYDVLCSDVVIFTTASLPSGTPAPIGAAATDSAVTSESEPSPAASGLARRGTATAQALSADVDTEVATGAIDEATEEAEAIEVDEATGEADSTGDDVPRKKLVKKRIIKKVVKKKAPAAEGEPPSGDGEPRLAPPASPSPAPSDPAEGQES